MFDNDFPALLPIDPRNVRDINNQNLMFISEPIFGVCRVICFSHRHDLTLPELPQEEVEAVVLAWADQTRKLGDRDDIAYVQVFENKGEMMGCSNPHPHSQIWATSILPNEITKEYTQLINFREREKTCLLCDYLKSELENGERVVTSNEYFTALVPYWAVWPFEILVISRRHVDSLPKLNRREVKALADLLSNVTTRYDNLFEIRFPYSMGFHQAPANFVNDVDFHLHAHFYPPLLRSATVRKFMVGFEMLAMPQRDLTPEKGAKALRSQSEVHFRCGREEEKSA